MFDSFFPAISLTTIQWLFGASFLVLLVLRVPVAFAMAMPSLIYLVGTNTPLTVIPHIMTTAFDSFVLIAIPMFMLAGALMNSGGITDRLFDFANKLVGHIRGGLAQVNVVASMIFAGMSGSAVADAGGLGQVEIKAMIKEGFQPEFAAAVSAASATIGPIIPPSIPLVIYGSTANVSVGALFLGGIIPGVLMCLFLMGACYLIALRHDFPRHAKASLQEIARSFLRAFPSLMTPVIIVAGIALGVFTPTEAAAVAVFYAFVLSALVYREVGWESISEMFSSVAKTSASILIILSAATLFSYVLTHSGLSKLAADSLIGFTRDKHLMLLVINVLLLTIGCFMEPVSVLLILVPMLLPIIDSLGIDRVHFGLVAVLNLMIGLITPPVGVCLYIVAKIANVSFESAVRATMPFTITLIVVLFIITYVPWLVTVVPRLVLT